MSQSSHDAALPSDLAPQPIASAAWHALFWLVAANAIGVLLSILLLCPALNRWLWASGRMAAGSWCTSIWNSTDGPVFRWLDFSSRCTARSAGVAANGAGQCCGCGPRRLALARIHGSPATPAASSFSIGPAPRASSFRWRCLLFGCCSPSRLFANGKQKLSLSARQKLLDFYFY